MPQQDLCRYGTSFRAKHWRSLDLCGCFGVLLSLSVHLYAIAVIATQLIDHSLVSTILFFGGYMPCALLALLSLYKAWSTNPGAVPLGARPLTTVRRAGSNLSNNNSRSIRRCPHCHDNYKPPRAHHDRITGRCIVKFDHFCPWVGNAVGALNHKFFGLFLLYTSLCCVQSLLLLFLRAIHCGFLDEETNDYLYAECGDFYASRLNLGLLVASVLFLVFTVSMGCEQLEAIRTGQGKIARMKMRVGQSGATELQRVTEEFNEMFGGESPTVQWHWWLPTSVEFPRGMKKVVLGYEWDESFERTAYQEDSDREMDDMETAGPTTELTNAGLLRSDSSVSMESTVKKRKEIV